MTDEEMSVFVAKQNKKFAEWLKKTNVFAESLESLLQQCYFAGVENIYNELIKSEAEKHFLLEILERVFNEDKDVMKDIYEVLKENEK